ncbi:hypothetical protein Tco_0358963 [Tanacetum coccineum]
MANTRRYREYDLAHLKLVFEFSIYKVWKSVEYGVSNGLDTAYWGFLEPGKFHPFCDLMSSILTLHLKVVRNKSSQEVNTALLITNSINSVSTASTILVLPEGS